MYKPLDGLTATVVCLFVSLLDNLVTCLFVYLLAIFFLLLLLSALGEVNAFICLLKLLQMDFCMHILFSYLFYHLLIYIHIYLFTYKYFMHTQVYSLLLAMTDRISCCQFKETYAYESDVESRHFGQFA